MPAMMPTTVISRHVTWARQAEAGERSTAVAARMPVGLPMMIESSTNHVPAPKLPSDDAGVDEPEEKQHHVDRPLEPMLEFVERVVRVRRFHEESGIARGVREETE